MDLLSFDAFEVLSSGLATASIILALKKDDQEKLAEILGSIGIVAIISANPIMGIFVILMAAYAYVVKKKDLDKVALGQGAFLSGLSLGLFSIMGMPLLLEIGIVIVVTGLTKKLVLKNDDLHRLALQHLKAFYQAG